MNGIYQRTESLIGTEAVNKLRAARVALFGVGGVGSAAAEALARSGVGNITVVDCDAVDETNINRQLIALTSTVGEMKVDVAEKRILDINPEAKVTKYPILYGKETETAIDFNEFDYVLDAVDNVTAKLLIAKHCTESGTPLISCLGTGNRVRMELLRVTDIAETSGCPLARVMRHELKAMGINHLKVVFSTEIPQKTVGVRTPSSMAFVPNGAGLLMAQEAVMSIIGAKI